MPIQATFNFTEMVYHNNRFNPIPSLFWLTDFADCVCILSSFSNNYGAVKSRRRRGRLQQTPVCVSRPFKACAKSCAATTGCFSSRLIPASATSVSACCRLPVAGCIACVEEVACPETSLQGARAKMRKPSTRTDKRRDWCAWQKLHVQRRDK